MDPKFDTVWRGIASPGRRDRRFCSRQGPFKGRWIDGTPLSFAKTLDNRSHGNDMRGVCEIDNEPTIDMPYAGCRSEQ